MPSYILDQVLAAEVGPQIHDLPAPEGNEQQGGADTEPFDTGVGALVGVSQLLLARSEVVHLGNDFGDCLLDAAELGLDRLQLLGGLDSGPVFRVGTNVDVELDVSVRVARSWYIWLASHVPT